MFRYLYKNCISDIHSEFKQTDEFSIIRVSRSTKIDVSISGTREVSLSKFSSKSHPYAKRDKTIKFILFWTSLDRKLIIDEFV